MGRTNEVMQTISATEVIQVLQADHKHDWDLSLARKGTEEHKRILNSLNEQLNPTFFNQDERKTKIDIKQGQILGRGKTLETQVDQSLTLRVSPDAVILHDNELACVEIKSSFNHYSLLQLLYGCIVADETYAGRNIELTQGILYLYAREENVLTLDGGGRLFWNDALRIAELAHEIKLNKSSKMMKVADMPVQDHRERAVINRNEMDELWGKVSHGLRQLMH